MAGVSVDGGKGKRRSLDSEINMIPMIDLLMVTISFLLITAVWVQAQRMESDAQVPGPATTPPCEGAECKPEPKLHVFAGDPTKFTLAWKDGATVVRSVDVPRPEHAARTANAKGVHVSYGDLAARIDDEWKTAGLHRDARDGRFDHAVVHTGNDMPYADIVAVMDAVARPKRGVIAGGKQVQTPAFEVTFAVD